jgi:hypothetical protein
MESYLSTEECERLSESLSSQDIIVYCFYGRGNNGKTTLAKLITQIRRDVKHYYMHPFVVNYDDDNFQKFWNETGHTSLILECNLQEEASIIRRETEKRGYIFKLFEFSKTFEKPRQKHFCMDMCVVYSDDRHLGVFDTEKKAIEFCEKNQPVNTDWHIRFAPFNVIHECTPEKEELVDSDFEDDTDLPNSFFEDLIRDCDQETKTVDSCINPWACMCDDCTIRITRETYEPNVMIMGNNLPPRMKKEELCAKIKIGLNNVDEAQGIQNKTRITRGVFRLLVNNIWFMDHNEKFRLTVRRKLEEFKTEEFEPMRQMANYFYTQLFPTISCEHNDEFKTCGRAAEKLSSNGIPSCEEHSFVCDECQMSFSIKNKEGQICYACWEEKMLDDMAFPGEKDNDNLIIFRNFCEALCKIIPFAESSNYKKVERCISKELGNSMYGAPEVIVYSKFKVCESLNKWIGMSSPPTEWQEQLVKIVEDKKYILHR